MQVRTLLQLDSATAVHRVAANAQLSALRASSRTNLAGALFQGISQQTYAAAAPQRARVHPDEHTTPAGSTAPAADPVRAVMLFTDGQPTTGECDRHRIVRTMENMLAGHMHVVSNSSGAGATHDCAASPPPPIKVHTFGFGSDTDASMLGAIAEAGNGSYYYISTPDDIPAAFADALGGLLSVAAQNVVLRLSPANGARITAVRCGFDTAADGADWIVRLPDLYAEEVKDLVVAVELPSMHGEDVPEDVDFVAATVRVDFIDTVRASPAVLTGDMRVHRSAEAATNPNPPSARVRAQIMRMDAMESVVRVRTPTCPHACSVVAAVTQSSFPWKPHAIPLPPQSRHGAPHRTGFSLTITQHTHACGLRNCG